jgi:hypothetical protein
MTIARPVLFTTVVLMSLAPAARAAEAPTTKPSTLEEENRALRSALTLMEKQVRDLRSGLAKSEIEVAQLRQRLAMVQRVPAPGQIVPGIPGSPFTPSIPPNWVPKRFNDGTFYLIPLEQQANRVVSGTVEGASVAVQPPDQPLQLQRPQPQTLRSAPPSALGR